MLSRLKIDVKQEQEKNTSNQQLAEDSEKNAQVVGYPPVPNGTFGRGALDWQSRGRACPNGTGGGSNPIFSTTIKRI